MDKDLVHVLKGFGLWTLGQVVYGAIIAFAVVNYFPNTSEGALFSLIAAPYVLTLVAMVVDAARTDKWFSRR